MIKKLLVLFLFKSGAFEWFKIFLTSSREPPCEPMPGINKGKAGNFFLINSSSLLAVAPTVSNSVITGGISAGIEPLPGNVYTFNGAKGTFIRKNKVLEALLEEKKQNKNKWWEQMLQDGGSVQNLPDSVLTPDEKELFLTFSEINQLELVRQAAIRQRYIDQTQSLNLSFDPNDSPKWINQVHMEAWKLGIKTLYYLRTDSVIKGDLGSRMADCVSCDG